MFSHECIITQKKSTKKNQNIFSFQNIRVQDSAAEDNFEDVTMLSSRELKTHLLPWLSSLVTLSWFQSFRLSWSVVSPSTPPQCPHMLIFLQMGVCPTVPPGRSCLGPLSPAAEAPPTQGSEVIVVSCLQQLKPWHEPEECTQKRLLPSPPRASSAPAAAVFSGRLR